MRELLRPVVVAPMAGGPTTPELVIAAGRAGALGFLAAGYKTPEAVEVEVRSVRAFPFPYGLNIFVPMPPLTDPAAVERYREVLRPEAERYEVELPPVRATDDDHFTAKVELAVAHRVPLVSFTFGVPPAEVVRALQAAGTAVLITVTSGDEARRALAVAPDGLITQGGGAGGHSSTFSPDTYRGERDTAEVLAEVLSVTDRPVVAAGGAVPAGSAVAAGSAVPVGSVVPVGGAVPALLAAGAAAVQCGTAFLLADEAGTRPAQRAAMLAATSPSSPSSALPPPSSRPADSARSARSGDPALSAEGRGTVVTRAFTGQPARALRNRFVDTYSAVAPVGYPAIHHLTAPIRAAAARAGDAEALNLWAGVGYASARPAPVAALIDDLQS
ncbi:nitronate monooxygenase [Actinoplanes sp. HUAS TT8]|uniref:nitronate monooxygenase n=1 Tax=Actinoplanes sp. HUAS TT8 TaxID=3447453 RepID=UPI003F524751